MKSGGINLLFCTGCSHIPVDSSILMVEIFKCVRFLMKVIFLFFLVFSSELAAQLKLQPRTLELLNKYCSDCHADGVDKGGIDFDKLLKQPLNSEKTKATWDKVWDCIEKEQMPPADKKKQPSTEEREEMMIGLEVSISNIQRNQQYAGKIELSRMNAKQLEYSLQTGLEVWLDVQKMLPQESSSFGFDNIGSIMNISPLLFERLQKVAHYVSFETFNKNSSVSWAKKSGDNWLKKFGDGKDTGKLHASLRHLGLRLYRRPLNDKEFSVIVKLYEDLKKSGLDHRECIQECVQSMLSSPAFILRTELLRTDKVEGSLARLDEYALASRLSFFLWNSSPDYHMLEQAEKGEFRKNLRKNVDRMINSGRIQNFAMGFGEQWLHLKYIKNNLPSGRVFKGFDRELLDRMRKETLYFFQYLVKENRPMDELFTSRVTFLDKSLQDYYGVKADDNKKKGYAKVTMPENKNRVGILSHPSVLIVTSDPDRTSPVKRGAWLLENILGMPPPPAPANVAPIEPDNKSKSKLTFRQKLEKHREDKACASCHAMMDPLGFAWDNYDAIGKWRTKDSKGNPVDVKTNWRGDQINSFNDLQKLLSGKYRRKFIKCLTEKMMIFALGRGLEIHDRIAIMKIVDKVDKPKSTFQDLIYAIVESTPFQYRSTGDE